jgi:molecular chaperone GrpE
MGREYGRSLRSALKLILNLLDIIGLLRSLKVWLVSPYRSWGRIGMFFKSRGVFMESEPSKAELTKEAAAETKISEQSLSIEEVQALLDQEKQKADDHWQRLLRKEAEYQNTLKRLQQDMDNTKKFATERFSSDLLAVVDSLERGLAAVPEQLEDNYKPLREGMEITLKQLEQVLEKSGVIGFEAKGKLFDPQFHAALSVQETEEVPPNHVVLVIQKGYLLHGRLLRPASVIVSKTKETVKEETKVSGT